MKKYWHVVNIGIQNNPDLSGQLPVPDGVWLCAAAGDHLSLARVYRDKPMGASVGAYTLAQMTSYT